MTQALQQRDQARDRLRESRQRLRAAERELRRAGARIAELDADLHQTRDTMNHFRKATREYERRVEEGRAALFDYPHVPRPRTFERPGKAYFRELLAAGDAAYAELLGSLAGHLGPLRAIGEEETEPHLPYWSNPWLPPLDGIAIYGLLAHHRPALYLEVGSGNSTKFARRAIQDHGLDTRIVSVDPYPRAEIDALCDEVIRTPYEDVDLDLLDRLQPGDLMFVDNSHRSFTNSDVTVFFTETLPYLRRGVVYGLHDIFLPDDYPAEWNERYYSEQYLLMCYLLGGAGGDTLHLPVHHVARTPALVDVLAEAWPLPQPLDHDQVVGGGFWMVKA